MHWYTHTYLVLLAHICTNLSHVLSPPWLLYATGCIWSAHCVSSGNRAAASGSVISTHAEQPPLLPSPDTPIVIEFALRLVMIEVHANLAGRRNSRNRLTQALLLPGGLLSSSPPLHSMQQYHLAAATCPAPLKDSYQEVGGKKAPVISSYAAGCQNGWKK